MSLSPPPPGTAASASAVAAAAAASVLLNSANINRMEDHLLTRFHHIDPELVDDYITGRRRQVINSFFFKCNTNAYKVIKILYNSL